MSLCITLDKNVLDIMTSNRLKLDEVFLLLCFHTNNFDLLNDYLRDKTYDQKLIVFQPLVRKMLLYVKEVSDPFKPSDYALTQEGMFLAIKLVASIKSGIEQEQTVGKTEIESLVEEYINLFPKGVKNGGNKLLRSNYKDILAKMRRFQIKYGYDKETILKATKNFLDRLRGVYTYCPTAEYFVMKDGSSALATECDMIKDIGGDEDIINPFERRM